MENNEESNEKERLRMRIAVLEESVKSCEVECRASRETVLRLVAELDQERKRTASSAAALDALKAEFDGLAVGRKSVEMDNQTLGERLEASRRVTEAARRESLCLEKQVEELERKNQAAEGRLQRFLEKAAALLQEASEGAIQPTEGDVLQNLDHLCNKTVSALELKLRRASQELSEQAELQRSTEQRSQLAEQQLQDLSDRLQVLESELLAADVQRDGLQHSRQHYEEFLEQLSETLRVDGLALDLGFDMRLKLILSRAEQLVGQEGSALAESKSLTYSLQRKLKSNKDQLQSKGLHIQLLRKKVAELEEERRSTSALAVARDDAHLELRRLQKRLERLQGELKAAKVSNTELKAQLCHTDELKLRVAEQSQTVQEQRKKLDQLVDGKAKAEKKLSAASSDLQSRERRSREDQQRLESLRQSLVQASNQQRDLVDFRAVVSQMLGLDAAASDLPNSEIFGLLEAFLLHARHHHHHHLHSHCAVHQRPHLLQVHEVPGSGDVSTSTSACLGDTLPLH